MLYFIVLLLFGGVWSVQAGEISANQLHRDNFGVFHAEGDVRMQSHDFNIHADRLDIDLDAKSGEMYNATVQFYSGQTLQGAYLQRIDLERFRGEDIWYSACPEDDMAWRLTAEQATLDQESGTFVANHAWFELGGVPVMYAPRWQHALSRRSGFLLPSIAQGSRRGLEITTPFYWAASPSWDMTFTPRWMDLRGWMAEVDWRHTSISGSESLKMQSLFDKETQIQRSRLQSDMAWQLDAKWRAKLDVDWVSDGLFVADYPQLDELESLAYLTSHLALGWADSGHSATLSGQYQQRLGDVSNASTLQIFPRLQTTHAMDFEHGKSLRVEHQTTLFHREAGVSGWRVGLKPQWQKVWQGMGGAAAANWMVSAQYVGYKPEQFSANSADYAALASSLTLELGIERVFADKQWRHEVKPMLRFDVSAAPNQEDIPLYDSALTPLAMGNLFYGNRYSGWDRFERMQRVSMLLVSSLQHKSEQGAVQTVLQGQLGVTVDALRESVDHNLVADPSRSQSNLLAELAWLPHQAWRVSVGGQHDPELLAWVESHALLTWSGAANNFFTASWQRTTATHSLEAESMHVSGKVNLDARWSIDASGQYDVLREQMLQTSGGVAYVHPCWDMSLQAFQSYQVGSDRLSDVGVRLLLAFDGLGSVGD